MIIKKWRLIRHTKKGHNYFCFDDKNRSKLAEIVDVSGLHPFLQKYWIEPYTAPGFILTLKNLWQKFKDERNNRKLKKQA